MVKVDTLYQIDVRLREIKGISKPFGGVSLHYCGIWLVTFSLQLLGSTALARADPRMRTFHRFQ